MAVKTKEELNNSLKTLLGDRTDDDALNFLGDFTDTVNDYETRVADTTDWKNKYEENDAHWRATFKERFFSGGGDEPDEPESPKPVIKSFDDLFEIKK